MAALKPFTMNLLIYLLIYTVISCRHIDKENRVVVRVFSLVKIVVGQNYASTLSITFLLQVSFNYLSESSSCYCCGVQDVLAMPFLNCNIGNIFPNL